MILQYVILPSKVPLSAEQILIRKKELHFLVNIKKLAAQQLLEGKNQVIKMWNQKKN
jgi:hypothetical protein